MPVSFDEVEKELPGASVRINRFYTYWKSLIRGADIPARSDFDPLDIPDQLPWLTLAERVSESTEMDERSSRFRYRVVGTGVVSFLGRDATGKWFDQIYKGEAFTEFQSDFFAVARDRKPLLKHIQYKVPDRDFITYSRLSLPFAEPGCEVNMILSLLDFSNIEANPAYRSFRTVNG